MSDLAQTSAKILAMIPLLRHFVGWLLGAFRSREDLMLENLALRQQLLALHAKRPRQRLGSVDKVFWVALRKLWSGWKKPLLLVTPETVVRWHRIGFRLYWSWLSRTRRAGGRKRLSREVRDLIFRMVAEPVSVPSSLWAVVLLGAVISIFTSYVFKVESLLVHGLMTTMLTSMIALLVCHRCDGSSLPWHQRD